MDHDMQAVEAAIKWFEVNLETLDALPLDASAAPSTKSVNNNTTNAATAEPKKKTAAPSNKKAAKGAAPKKKKSAPQAAKTTVPVASTSTSSTCTRPSRIRKAGAERSPKPKHDPAQAMLTAASVSAPTRITQSRASKEAATRKLMEVLSLSSSSSVSSSESSSNFFAREETLDTSSEGSSIVVEAEAPTVTVTSPTPNKGVFDVISDYDSAPPLPDAVAPKTLPFIDGLDHFVQSYWLGESSELGASWVTFATGGQHTPGDNALSPTSQSGGDTQAGFSSNSGTANSPSVESLTPRRFPAGGSIPIEALPSLASPRNGQAGPSASVSVSDPTFTNAAQPQAGAFGLFN